MSTRPFSRSPSPSASPPPKSCAAATATATAAVTAATSPATPPTACFTTKLSATPKATATATITTATTTEAPSKPSTPTPCRTDRTDSLPEQPDEADSPAMSLSSALDLDHVGRQNAFAVAYRYCAAKNEKLNAPALATVLGCSSRTIYAMLAAAKAESDLPPPPKCVGSGRGDVQFKPLWLYSREAHLDKLDAAAVGKACGFTSRTAYAKIAAAREQAGISPRKLLVKRRRAGEEEVGARKRKASVKEESRCGSSGDEVLFYRAPPIKKIKLEADTPSPNRHLRKLAEPMTRYHAILAGIPGVERKHPEPTGGDIPDWSAGEDTHSRSSSKSPVLVSRGRPSPPHAHLEPDPFAEFPTLAEQDLRRSRLVPRIPHALFLKSSVVQDNQITMPVVKAYKFGGGSDVVGGYVGGLGARFRRLRAEAAAAAGSGGGGGVSADAGAVDAAGAAKAPRGSVPKK